MKFIINLLVVVSAILVGIFYLVPDPPFISDVNELPSNLQAWYGRGNFLKINGHNIFFIHERCTDRKIKDPPTFAILHGYPSSTHEYHKIIEPLLKYGDVIMHDHVGFGFSDKPKSNFTYSMAEAADNSLAVWRKAGVRSAHVVSHDMGDTVLTEILARRHRELLPEYFNSFFLSVTFSNGGMKYSLINFRLGQTLGTSKLAPFFIGLLSKLQIGGIFLKRNLRSIWSPTADPVERDEDIADMVLLSGFNGGSQILHKSMYYLWDRAHFEFRWFDALSKIDIRTRFIWGDSDAVAPVAIPNFFKSFVPGIKITFIEGTGHFLMLENPKRWINEVVQLVKS